MKIDKWLKLFIFVLIFLTIKVWSLNAPTLNVVLLADQSNMAGAGNYDELNQIDKARLLNASKIVFLSSNLPTASAF